MREHYDFSDAIKNPFAERMKKGYTIIISHGPEDKDKKRAAKKYIPLPEETTAFEEYYRANGNQ